MRETLRAAIFDMDGLLLDSEPFWQRAESEVFAEVGVTLSPDDLRETIGMRIDEVAAHWYRVRGWDRARMSSAQLVEHILERVEGMIRARGEPLPGVHDAIDRFQVRGLRLALASSSPRRVIRVALETLGLGGRFEVVHSAETEPRGKPDPAVYRTTARRLDVASSQCLALEDSLSGFAAAHAAGMRCVVVPDRRLRGDPGFAAAALVLGSLADLDDRALDRLGAVLS